MHAAAAAAAAVIVTATVVFISEYSGFALLYVGPDP